MVGKIDVSFTDDFTSEVLSFLSLHINEICDIATKTSKLHIILLKSKFLFHNFFKRSDISVLIQFYTIFLDIAFDNMLIAIPGIEMLYDV